MATPGILERLREGNQRSQCEVRTTVQRPFKAVLLGTTATNAGHWPPRVICYRFRRRGVLHMRIKFRLFHLKKCKLNLSELKIYR